MAGAVVTLHPLPPLDAQGRPIAATTTASAGGRLELPAALSDMLEQGSDGPQ